MFEFGIANACIINKHAQIKCFGKTTVAEAAIVHSHISGFQSRPYNITVVKLSYVVDRGSNIVAVNARMVLPHILLLLLLVLLLLHVHVLLHLPLGPYQTRQHP